VTGRASGRYDPVGVDEEGVDAGRADLPTGTPGHAAPLRSTTDTVNSGVAICVIVDAAEVRDELNPGARGPVNRTAAP
jgi:hypothetical protein